MAVRVEAAEQFQQALGAPLPGRKPLSTGGAAGQPGFSLTPAGEAQQQSRAATQQEAVRGFMEFIFQMLFQPQEEPGMTTEMANQPGLVGTLVGGESERADGGAGEARGIMPVAGRLEEPQPQQVAQGLENPPIPPQEPFQKGLQRELDQPIEQADQMQGSKEQQLGDMLSSMKFLGVDGFTWGGIQFVADANSPSGFRANA